jgi:hypothetical protein
VDDTNVAASQIVSSYSEGRVDAPDLGPLVIPLLKGVMYRNADENRWLTLLRQEGALRDYVRTLGLEVIIDEAEGYSFLRTPPSADDAGTTGDEALPRLMSRRRLTYGVSLLLALLRKRLAEADAQGGDTRLVMTRTEIADLVGVFLPSSTNEAKVADRVEKDILKVVELGFLQQIGARTRRGEEPSYEVRRILKAFIDAQWMSDFAERLSAYRSVPMDTDQSGSEPDGSESDGTDAHEMIANDE